MRLAFTFLLSAALTTQVAAQTASPQVLAEYSNGTFLENVATSTTGALVITSYLNKSLEIIEPGKPARTLAILPAHPVGIVRHKSGYIVSAHGSPFTSGPAFTQQQQVLVLSADGKVTSSFPAPDARFLNGLVTHTGGAVLAADSIAGVIWRIDQATRTVTPWLRDPTFLQDATSIEFRPGANGLKRQGDRLLISNSSLGHLVSVKIDAKGNPSGAVTVLAKTGPIDDFLVTVADDVIFASHGAALKRISKAGMLSDLMTTGCDGCTALVSFKSGKQRGIAILTTGSLLEGGRGPARVLFLPMR